MFRVVWFVLFCVALAGCCCGGKRASASKSSSGTTTAAPTSQPHIRDSKAEAEIVRTLRQNLTNPKYGDVDSISVEAMDARDGTIYAKLKTNLYSKKSNESPATGICGAVLNGTFNGKTLDSVEVFASNGARLAKTRRTATSYFCIENRY